MNCYWRSPPFGVSPESQTTYSRTTRNRVPEENLDQGDSHCVNPLHPDPVHTGLIQVESRQRNRAIRYLASVRIHLPCVLLSRTDQQLRNNAIVDLLELEVYFQSLRISCVEYKQKEFVREQRSQRYMNYDTDTQYLK